MTRAHADALLALLKLPPLDPAYSRRVFMDAATDDAPSRRYAPRR